VDLAVKRLEESSSFITEAGHGTTQLVISHAESNFDLIDCDPQNLIAILIESAL